MYYVVTLERETNSMLTLKGINETMNKLNSKRENGEFVEGEIQETNGKKHDRFSYIYKNQLVFTIGFTRSPRKRSKKFNYVPRQMHLQRQEYRILHACDMSKREYNEKLIEEGKITQ